MGDFMCWRSRAMARLTRPTSRLRRGWSPEWPPDAREGASQKIHDANRLTPVTIHDVLFLF